MKRYSKETKNKRTKMGVLSGISVVAVVAIAIALNLAVAALDISLDMTEHKVYTLSNRTTNIVKELEQDVTVYILDSEENFPLDYKQILQQYERLSSHVQLRYRDMNLYPEFAQQYTQEEPLEDSLIVVSGENSVYLDASKFTTTTISADSTSYKMEYELEPLVTTAINKVNGGESGIVYQTTGHSELQLTNSVQTALLRNNFILQDISLQSEQQIPEDVAVVLVYAPAQDFSEDECRKLHNYLDKGGRLYLILDAVVETENLDALMKEYGIVAVDGIVLEQDATMIYTDSDGTATPSYIIPKVENSTLTGGQNAEKPLLFIPVARGLQLEDKEGFYQEGMLSTSKYAYAKVDLYSDYVSREDDDIQGPFYLSVLSESENGGKMLVLSSANALTDNVDAAVYGNNVEFFVSGINYLEENPEKIYIGSKKVEFQRTLYSQAEVWGISGIAVVGIPLLILLVGVAVMVYRRRLEQGKIVKRPDVPEESLEELLESLKEYDAKNMLNDTEEQRDKAPAEEEMLDLESLLSESTINGEDE